jgi:hypothetical protein
MTLNNSPKIAGCILRLFDEQLMPDTSIVAGGKEIRAHRAILVSSSGFFREHFGAGGSEKIEVKEPYKAVRAFIRFLYFGSLVDSELGPEDALDLLGSARDYGIDVLTEEDAQGMIVPQLSLQNCLAVLHHQELLIRPKIAQGVCTFVGENFATLLKQPTSRMHLLNASKNYLIEILKVVCKRCGTQAAAAEVVTFVLEYAQMDNACDLLRDCKTWQWNTAPESLSKMRDPLEAMQTQKSDESPAAEKTGGDLTTMSEAEIFEMLDVNKDGSVSREEFAAFKATLQQMSSYRYVEEWVVPNVKSKLNGEPLCQLSCGEFFEWRVRIDNGQEGNLRIVYEDVNPKFPEAECCRRFPAATFAWKVKFRGEEIFTDRPVFITFADRVALHWSTTLGVDSSMLTDDDSLTVSVTMTENPLLSLILYFLSSNVKNESYAEDILNRLPHIEYRCLSSFFIFRQASRPQSADRTLPA